MPRCFGEANGRIDVFVSGGRAPYRYAWNTGVTTFTLTNVPANTYTLTITDANGCVTQQDFVLTQPDPLGTTAQIENPICFGYSNGSIALQPYGGTAPYAYLWLSDRSDKPELLGLKSGVYHLRIFDSRHCMLDTNFIVVDPPKIVIQNLDYNRVLCTDQFYQPDPQPDTLAYTWTSTNGFFSIERTPQLYSGTYIVKAVSIDDCYVFDTITITNAYDTVSAEYWVNCDVFQNEHTTIVHVSYPPPDSTLWVIPDNVEIIELGYEYVDLIFRDTGVHVIGLIVYKGACADLSERIIFVNEAREFSELGSAPSLFDYIIATPNPTSDMFDLSFRVVSDASLTIRLFRSSNQELMRTVQINARANRSYREPFVVSSFVRGMYILTVQCEIENKILKIIVI
jgi:hypothetical protein